MSERVQATGGCYCGALRYTVDGVPVMKAQCHCRPCQYITGGGPNYFFIVPNEAYEYTNGAPQRFARSDLDQPRTREFCATCGTHMTTRLPHLPLTVVKVGTLDDPNLFAPEFAIHCAEIADFHVVPEGMAAFETLPPRA